MNHALTQEEWLNHFYREIKDFIANPSATAEAQLKSLVTEYRLCHESPFRLADKDEHEWVMDVR